jgi:hypothetical protein
MLVVEMPTTRTPPGAREMRRVSGCDACTPRLRFVAGSADTNSRPLSTFTAYEGTASASYPGSPRPVDQ